MDEEKVRFEIPKIENAIIILGNVYSDVRLCLLEFVINGADAQATRTEVSLSKNKKFLRISVLDDGAGMNNQEMKRIVGNVLNSSKALEAGKKMGFKKVENVNDILGKFGMGILSYQAFAENATFISKVENDDTLYKMVMNKGDKNVVLSKTDAEEEYSKMFLAKNLSHGTLVVFDKILPGSFEKAFKEDGLRNFFTKNLGSYLRENKNFSLYLNNVEIIPYDFFGEQFEQKIISTKYGDIKLDIHVLISETNRKSDIETLSISSSGKVVVGDIRTMSDFQHQPWLDNHITGQICCDFLKVNPNRSSYDVNTQEYFVFRSELEKIEPALIKFIATVKEDKKNEKEAYLLKKLTEAIDQAIKELKLDSFGNNPQPIKPREPTPPDGQEPVISSPPSPPHEPKIPPAYPPRPRNGVNVSFEDLGNLNIHSTLREGGLICINSAHPDYLYSSEKGEVEHVRYVAKLTSNELSIKNNENIDIKDVFEAATTLEMKILKILDLKEK